jgi:phosphopantetheinyl transferase (holo-ACP synthase)
MQDITILRGDVVNGLQTAPIVTVKIRKAFGTRGGSSESPGNTRAIAGEEVDEVWEEREVRCSISHDGEYATATCIAATEEAYHSNT